VFLLIFPIHSGGVVGTGVLGSGIDDGAHPPGDGIVGARVDGHGMGSGHTKFMSA
jgi:hypothetical protein